MTIASDFSRYDCLVGRRRRTYETLRREWVCSKCGGRLTVWYNNAHAPTRTTPGQPWEMRCARCHSQDFIHQNEYDRQLDEAAEVLDGLPEELRQQLERKDSK